MFVRPDWKDIKAYSESPNMTLGFGIAWEFLRRNPDYQKDVYLYRDEVVAFCEQNEAAFLESLEDHESPEWFFSKADFYECGQPERFSYWHQLLEQKWGLNYAYFPNDEWTGEGFVLPTLDKPETFERIELGNIKGPRVLIEVDLSEPLESLLKKAEHRIRYLRDRAIDEGTVTPVTSRVLSKAVYVEYLRILDGVAAGETLQKIGEIISPNAENDPTDKQRDKRIRAAHKAALKMQESGFRVLV